MTTTAPNPTPFKSIDDQPCQHFAEFERQVYDDTGSSCLEIFTLFSVVSTAIWESFPDNNIIIDGIQTIQQRNFLLPPTQPADNAIAGIWKAF